MIRRWIEVAAERPRIPNMGSQIGAEVSYYNPHNWDYSSFHYYLVDSGLYGFLDHGRVKPWALPLAAFPETMALNQRWHSILNYMRRKSQADDRERFELIGHNKHTDLLFFSPEVIAARNPGDTSVHPSDAERQLLIGESLGIENEVGYLHSHNPSYEGRLERWINRLLRKPWGPRLSGGDFYLLLEAIRYPLSVVGLADGNKNIFAFRTKETPDIPDGGSRSGQSAFNNYCTDNQISNVAIAQALNITLYEGQANGLLHRMYPPTPNPRR